MNDVSQAVTQPWWRIYFNKPSVFFWGVHVGAVAGIALTGWSWLGLGLALAWYGVLMFFVTAGHHRYFSHRTYKTSRAMQFLLGLGTTLTAQKGPLWWAAHHRRHHKESDGEGDVHSPARTGFWFSHLGWFMCHDFEGTDLSRVRDLARYPELVWLNRLSLAPPVALGAVLFYLGGASWVCWYLLSIVLIWHGTFTINSLSHVIGSRRYETGDDSRNNVVLAFITHGEGWHNNHHHYQSSCRQGFHWYEWDLSYYILRLMSVFGLVWDLRAPPRHIIEDRPKFPVAAAEPVPDDLAKAA